jgi:transcription factor SFP1
MPTLPSGRVWVPPANKPYKCPVPGCDKAYKQQNGLKYHRLHGHCNNRAGGATGKEAEGRETLEEKPYGCYVGAACGKRYKKCVRRPPFILPQADEHPTA